MQLDHQFTVNAPVDVVWRALLDPERVAPCMPGATLTSVDGSAFAGSVKVKLGPISLLYKGTGEFVESDEAARQVKIKAAGKDTRSGTAAADVTVQLSEKDGVTTGSVTTELTITGKPAQFGRGMIAEVGGRILDTFAGNLAKQLGDSPEPQQPAAAEKKAAPVVEPLRAVPDPPTAEPIDLVSFAGTPVLKRLAPLIIVVIVVVFLLFRRRGK
ncbi:carbon monoxide dehydrogenase subunit G [Kibdelosporangium banguiense]|uniref:Carbon monoxide dehydrogenase subunit G n=1 Tax=Kibdelosporangium banguiense TaxID=1365924 RepID=A0ABS4T9Y0_9PSEU|nr:SRPBCC family protein [Kibdelosporangium banguiense]MBP2321232.1 carbon monoxide dehydrogenase subunit G [Kibdelosporangium banguiense]